MFNKYNYDNEKRVHSNFILFNVFTLIFYLILSFISIFLLEYKSLNILIGFIYVIFLFFLLLSMIICNICISKLFDPVNKIFGYLSMSNIIVKICCFFCSIISIQAKENIEIILLIIVFSMCIDYIFSFIKHKHIKNVTNEKLQEFIDNVVDITYEDLLKYEKALNIFSKTFIFIIILSPIVDRFFTNTIFVFLSLALCVFLITIIINKANILIYTKKELIRSLIINISIATFGILLILSLYSKMIVLSFYPTISNDELMILFIVFIMPFFYPARKVYYLTKAYGLKNNTDYN